MSRYTDGLEKMLAGLVDLPTQEDYDRGRANLYASVLASLAFKNCPMTKKEIREVALEALQAEALDPGLKKLIGTRQLRRSNDNPNEGRS